MNINPHDRIRGSVDVPLTDEGKRQVKELGSRIKAAGGLDKVHAADLQRTTDTGDAIRGKAPMMVSNKLRDINYGIYTGASTKEALPSIHRFIKEMPDMAIPNGESFNQYKAKLLPHIGGIMDEFKQNPDQKVGIVLNRRSIKTIQAWLAAGHKPSLETDPEVATSYEKSEGPGSMQRIAHDNGKWTIDNTSVGDKLKPGIYLIRHGLTSWNGESHQSS